MSQTRLYLTAGREDATRIFDALETEFEEEGFPIAVLEVDASVCPAQRRASSIVAASRPRSRASVSGTKASLMPCTAVETTDGAASRTNRLGRTRVPSQNR